MPTGFRSSRNVLGIVFFERPLKRDRQSARKDRIGKILSRDLRRGKERKTERELEVDRGNLRSILEVNDEIGGNFNMKGPLPRRRRRRRHRRRRRFPELKYSSTIIITTRRAWSTLPTRRR